MCELNLNKTEQESAPKGGQSVLGTPQFYPQIHALLLGAGLPLLVQILREVVSPRRGTERGLDSLWSRYPLETQPVEYWSLRILRLSLCFLTGDSGQWRVCVRGVEGGQVSPRWVICVWGRKAQSKGDGLGGLRGEKGGTPGGERGARPRC